MGISTILLVLAIDCFFVGVSARGDIVTSQYSPCDEETIACIRSVNEGAMPPSFSEQLANNNWRIVYNSKFFAEEAHADCISTHIGIEECYDTYYNNCKYVKTGRYNITYIDDYIEANNVGGVIWHAYTIYHCKETQVVSYYVCSPYGESPFHVDIYCPWTLDDEECRRGMERARKRLEICGIANGKRMCEKRCHDCE
uniref:Uncharacterized protein n=1 Tax=Cuerna arida TaxID=1464854 RepID=A0A1B6GK64_9HEMI